MPGCRGAGFAVATGAAVFIVTITLFLTVLGLIAAAAAVAGPHLGNAVMLFAGPAALTGYALLAWLRLRLAVHKAA